LLKIHKIAVEYKLINFSGEECTRKTMNHKKHKTNFQQVGSRGISSLLVGSIVGGAVLYSTASLANPVPNSPSQSIGKLSSNAPATPVDANTGRIAQASDTAGNWAEPFIKVLVEKGIIAGYPDGTFKPDQPVTRAEFAALLNKAFDLQPTRAARKFKDVSKKSWANNVIQKAYQGGFLAGYPNGTFGPNQNIQRIQSVVSLINGNKIEPKGALDINSVYGDAAQVPAYGQNALTAATQGCIAVSNEFDSSKLPGGNFNPTGTATRADVAAFLHQVLVGTGKLQPLGKDSPGNKYIASCPGGVYVATITPTDTPPTPGAPAPTADEAIAKLSVPTQLPELMAGNAVTTFPVGGLQTPSAFGANWGDVFIGAGYQGSTRPPAVFRNATSTPSAPAPGGILGVRAANAADPALSQNESDGNVGIGIGIGDSKNFLGLETVYNSVSTFRSGFFNNSTVSFKLHKQFGDGFAIAAGWENAIQQGNVDGGSSKYGVASLVLNPDPNQGFFSNTTLSVGAGDGRFNSIEDIIARQENINVFGSIGTRLFPGVALIADWNGQDLGVGLPITLPLGTGASFQVTPGVVDLVNEKSGGSRFVLGAGLGFRF
jgi:hypothetical protein